MILPVENEAALPGRGSVIQIAFTADRDYVPHAAAMLHSLLVANPGEHFVFYFLQGPDFSDHDGDALARWLRGQDVQLERITVRDEFLQRFHTAPYFHRSIWHRVLLPDLLAKLPKVLYIDADTLVTGPLRPLWETDVSDYLFGAVVNPLYSFMPNFPVDRLGMPSAKQYMNSGVLLMNLDRMRREGFVEDLREYSRKHPENSFSEQDALAALYHQRCLFLHPRWNMQTTFYDLRLDELAVAREDVLDARSNPAIVHFIGPHKPSHYLCRHPYREAYLRHRQATPWPLPRLEGRTLLNFVIRRLPLVWAVRSVRLWRAITRQLWFDRPASQ